MIKCYRNGVLHLVMRLSIFLRMRTSSSLMMLISSTGTFSSSMFLMTEERLSSFSSLCSLCMVSSISLISRSLFCWSIHLMHSLISISIALFFTFFRSPYFSLYCWIVSLQLSTSSLSYSFCSPELQSLFSSSWVSQEYLSISFRRFSMVLSLWQRLSSIWSFFSRRQLFYSFKCLFVYFRLWIVISMPQSCFYKENIFFQFQALNFFKFATSFLYSDNSWKLRSLEHESISRSVIGEQSFIFFKAISISSWMDCSICLSLYFIMADLVVQLSSMFGLLSFIQSQLMSLLKSQQCILDQFWQLDRTDLQELILELALVSLSQRRKDFRRQSFICCFRVQIYALDKTQLALVEIGFYSNLLKFKAWFIFQRDLFIFEDVFLQGIYTFLAAYPQFEIRLFFRATYVWGLGLGLGFVLVVGIFALSDGLFLPMRYLSLELMLSLAEFSLVTGTFFSQIFLVLLLLTMLISIFSFEVPNYFSIMTLFLDQFKSQSV